MKNLNDLTKETNHKTRILWAANYWDGAITGMMLWEGQPAWFQQTGERSERTAWTQEFIDNLKKNKPDIYAEYEKLEQLYEETEIRQYKVYRVTREEFELREKNVDLWIEIGGNSWRYDENNKRDNIARVKPGFDNSWERFKKAQCPEQELTLTEDKVIGEFEW